MHKGENFKNLLIVPIYNEEKRLDLEQWKQISEIANFDILFVDDGSKDKTYQKLILLREYSKQISIINLPFNQGKGSAIYEGFKYASELDYKYAGVTDADLSVDSINLFKGLELITQDSNLFMVSGARVQLAGWNVNRTYLRRWIGRIIATLMSLISGLTIYDSQSPCKWYNLNYLDTLKLSKPRTRWFYEIEILLKYKLIKNEFRILEFPILGWQESSGSHLNLFSFLSIFREIFILINISARHKFKF